jgi:hypothetical protein
MIGLKFTAIAAVVALAVGFGSGWKTRDAFCDAAAAKARVASLETQLEARDTAAQQDAARVTAAEAEKANLENKARELEARIGTGECFSRDDSNQLRDLWQRK